MKKQIKAIAIIAALFIAHTHATMDIVKQYNKEVTQPLLERLQEQNKKRLEHLSQPAQLKILNNNNEEVIITEIDLDGINQVLTEIAGKNYADINSVGQFLEKHGEYVIDCLSCGKQSPLLNIKTQNNNIPPLTENSIKELLGDYKKVFATKHGLSMEKLNMILSQRT